MIRQTPGDLLEIEFEGKFYYMVVLTKITMFGGNIVFAFHGDGSRLCEEHLTTDAPGFNACTDLLWAKRKRTVNRIRRFDDISKFWKTRFAKGTPGALPGHKPSAWYIYRIDDLQNHIERTSVLPPQFADAMDHVTYSFSKTASLILEGYTPDKTPLL
ncbi:MAG TPA: hypothetical protein VGO67_11235 [Verrucomicrobiae bacterium]|jgi:hypothetical protein